MGAFGLNASILDAANLAWKIGLCASGFAKLDALVPTYEMERRRHAVKIIHTSGVYLRFICNSSLPVVDLSGVGTDLRDDEEDKSIYASVGADIEDKDLRFVAQFFAQYGPFLLGIDSAYGHSVINPRRLKEAKSGSHPTVVKNGVRAPNPRVCFSDEKTGYLYDKMAGAAIFNLVVFASDILGPVRNHLAAFSAALTSSNGFFRRFGGSSRFRIILVVKCLPFELPSRLVGAEFSNLRQLAEITFDDRAPDEDAHTCYSINHARGAVVVVRPDLWVGTSAFLGAQGASELDCYFEGFLQDVFPVNGEINNGLGDELTNGANGDVWDEINEKFQGKDNGSIEGVINGEHKDRINGGIAKELMADNKNPINSTVSEYTNGLY
ncbi:hypothetical protein MMC24_001520 [Lignoscripta atroalba]|nr:hypothetical protein [Lignoscripta atroalba]